MKHFTIQPNRKFLRCLLLSLFIAVYAAVFFFSFFSKGIFVDGKFYRKSANLTSVTYKAASIGADYRQIVLKKYIDYCTIHLDDKSTVTVYPDGSTDLEIHTQFTGTYSDEMWQHIAAQSAETIRGFGNKPWFVPVMAVVLLFAAKLNSTRLYSLIFPQKAAGERWYTFVDRTFYICLVFVLLYLVIPF